LIGEQPTGALPGIIISSVAHEGLRVEIDGRPAQLAVVDADGKIVAIGPQVARETEAVAINCYRAFWMGTGYLRTMSEPIKRLQE
jgi:hypothetical protein